MVKKPLINRRFVRVKAVQNLYAFYINQQATYQNALQEIKDHFIPDIFASIPANEAQLAQEKDQALSLFTAWVAGHQPDIRQATAAWEIAEKVWTNYKVALSQDIKILKNGWEAALDKLCTIGLLILQLMVEWLVMAQDQAQRNKGLQPTSTNYPIWLTHNHSLASLPHNPAFLRLVQQYNVSWYHHMDLVARWYNQFVKNTPYLTDDQQATNKLAQDNQALMKFLQVSILGQEDIQHFFSDLDINWIEHKPIIKKLLANLEVGVEQVVTTIETLKQDNAQSAHFYAQLINTCLQQDISLDTLIQQYIKNWSIERIVLLDRVIIKLALCEMCYLKDTPTKVIINEYIDLAKQYSTPKSASFINGMLDTIAKTI